ncbi:hypothetical protein CPB84DRAFT_441931 [Gymnopilus junonius]|uniref:Secreted protein n=1 Tax=Gymnopilus junonius TaxID=109634 RepID=A0A9P5NAJ7_GYMJU|nr:hypothetical protein CPB84DRAFT_441931 [Gymnopilus junonius]
MWDTIMSIFILSLICSSSAALISASQVARFAAPASLVKALKYCSMSRTIFLAWWYKQMVLATVLSHGISHTSM